jgi:processive 1,2-diacylglycerol beta-glucosyltransferase
MAARIILMYISENSGHHSATLAIEKALKILSPQSEILNINAFNYTNPISERIVNRLYMGLIKATPRIWDYLYDNPAVAKKIEKIKDNIHKLNSPKLKVLFDRFRPDMVACTQAFPCGMVADFKKTYDSKVPLAAILTDYIPHSYWVYDNIDYYIAPSQEVAVRLAKKGIDPLKIKPLGIPFDPKFTQPILKDQACQRLGLDPKQIVILVMGGGQGLGPIKTIVKSLEKVRHNFQEIVVTGTNKKLYRSLKKKIKKYKKKILLYGYAQNINELMSVSDIIITKPGGVTTAEALAKKMAMLIVKPIPGQEANNTVYLTEKGAAIKVDSAKQINFILEELLNDPKKLSSLRNSAGKISKPNSSFDIARLLLDAAIKSC